MTFQEAQTQFRKIIRRVTADSSAADLLKAQRDLDALEDQIRGEEGFESIRQAIDGIYDDLCGTLSAATVKRIKSRDKVFDAAAEAMNAIASEAENDAQTLALERTRMVLPALQFSATEVQAIVAAIKAGDMEQALAKGETLLALVEQLRAELDSDVV
jgi:hypothetical protein